MSKDTPQANSSSQAPSSWWGRLKEGLRRSSSGLSTGIGDLFTKRKLDAATLDDFEDLLLRADLGVDTATRITRAIASGRYGRDLDPDAVKAILVDEIEAAARAGGAPARCRARPQALRDLDGRGERLGEDDDHRQARRQAQGAGPQGDVRGGRHFSGGRHRAARALGRTHRRARHRAPARRRRRGPRLRGAFHGARSKARMCF